MIKEIMEKSVLNEMLERQQLEIDRLYRAKNYLTSFEYVDDIDRFNTKSKEFQLISSELFKKVFNRYRKYTTNNKNNKIIEKRPNKKHSKVLNLFVFQEREIEWLFFEIIMLMKQKSKKNRSFEYIKELNLIDEYHKSNEIYKNNVLKNKLNKVINIPLKRPFLLTPEFENSFNDILKRH